MRSRHTVQSPVEVDNNNSMYAKALVQMASRRFRRNRPSSDQAPKPHRGGKESVKEE